MTKENAHRLTDGSYCWQYCDQAKCRQLTKLSGPSQFTYFHDILDRRILLLGEIHIEAGLCQQDGINLADWIDELADQDYCLDLFMESPYITTAQQEEYLQKSYREKYNLVCPIYRLSENSQKSTNGKRQLVNVV
jgi:hypothetical protein